MGCMPQFSLARVVEFAKQLGLLISEGLCCAWCVWREVSS
jgi:hypothetical protein